MCWYLFFNLFCMALASVKKEEKKKSKKHICSLGQMVYFILWKQRIKRIGSRNLGLVFVVVVVFKYICMCVCIYTYIHICVYIYIRALQQTLTVSFSRESFLCVSTLCQTFMGWQQRHLGVWERLDGSHRSVSSERQCAVDGPWRGTDWETFSCFMPTSRSCCRADYKL